MPSSRFPSRVASRIWHLILPACMAVFLLAGMVRAPAALAAPATGAGQAVQAITVVIDDSYPPYTFRDAAGQLQGIVKDHWALWETYNGIHVDLRAMDWAKAQQAVQAGSADVIDTMLITEPRRKIYDFSAPYADIEVPIYFHRNISGIVDAASLKGFTVGVKDGGACVDNLRAHGIDQLQKYPNFESLITAAAASKIRIFCIDKPPAEYMLTKLGIQDEFRYSAPLYTGQFHRAFRKGNTQLMRLVEDGFAKIPVAELKAIDRKWLGSALGRPGDWWVANARYVAYAVLALAVLAFALFFWNRSLSHRVATNTAELTCALEQLRISEERWKFALEGARDAVWDFDVITGEEHASARWSEILGYAEGEMDANYLAWKGSIHPDDCPLVLARLQDCLECRTATYESEHRVRCKDGSWKWILVRGKVVARGADGKALRMLGTRSDITDRVRASEERNRFASIVKRSLTEIYLIDFRTLRFDYANDGALRNLGYSMDSLRTMTLFEIKIGLTESALRSMIEPLVRREKEVIVFDSMHRRADGSVYPVEVHLQLTMFEDHPVLLSLVLDTTERKETEKLRTAKEAAELASHTKTVFLASMSHELRTPLNSILGFAQLLEYETAVRDNENVQKKVAHIRSAGKHLLAMVEDILDLSGIEAGRVALSIEPVEMLRLLRECTALAELQAHRSNIGFNYVHDSEAYWVQGDHKRLKQVLVNLLSNAIKYNRDGGAINFRFDSDADRVTVAIQDTGFGLTQTQLDKLFEPFNRLGAENGATEGTGIGLVIVKQLVLAMHGTIEVASEPNVGSTFTLSFVRSAGDLLSARAYMA